MTRCVLSLVVAALLALAQPVFSRPAQAQQEPSCPTPADAVALSAPLPRVAGRVAEGRGLRVVAIGSSSTAGAGASAPDRSYPARLAVHLGRHFPTLPVTVLNKGVNGEQAPDMFARFQTDVLDQKPDLVIWQVGSNSILRDGDYAHYDAIVRDGVEYLGRRGIDVVLMDPQYAPAVLAKPRHYEMVARLSNIAADGKIGIFHRYGLMRWLVETQSNTMEDLVGPDGLHHTDQGYDCIARGLAKGIEAAARVRSAVLPPKR